MSGRPRLPDIARNSATVHPGGCSTDWIARAADAGQRFAITDLLIGSLAHEAGALVWSLDSDFERMERLKFVQRY